MASSSSFSTRNFNNMVFVSFHGGDSRHRFLSHLYKRLTAAGITTFKDDTELPRGKEIESGLWEAIESSMISIILLTQNYASSTYCLDELVKIMECREQGQMVVPIFFYVDPSDVADPTKGVYAAAFSSHRNHVKVEAWIAAMKQVADLSGFHLKPCSSEAILLDEIAADILRKIKQTPSAYTHEYVGIDYQIEQIIKSLLSTDSTSDPVRVIGIVGMGGIGKTTLARVIYEQISCEFNASSFLSVREILGRSGPVGLVEGLLSELLRDDKIIMNTKFISNPCYAMRLRLQKVLVVLDDFDSLQEWEDLIGTTQFGPGSRLILTSRNKQFLQNICNEIWEVKKLSMTDATQLFCKYAFKKDYCPNQEFKDMLSSILDYVDGNPLGLKVLGSSLHGKSKSFWLSDLERMRKLLHTRIYDVLKISFDDLESDLKRIFLRIACFFDDGDRWDVMISVLHSCGFSSAESGLTVLKDKCLLEDNPYGDCLRMHDLLREMGRKIVRCDQVKRIILDPEDMMQVFRKDSVSEEVEGIALNVKDFTDNYCLCDPQAFSKMPNLKFLKLLDYDSSWESDQFDNLQFPKGLVYLPVGLRLLQLESYPLKQLPAQFLPGNLVELKMSASKVERLWEGVQNLQKLKELHLSRCSRLIELPDLSCASNIRYIVLTKCESLVEIPISWSHLDKLNSLEFYDCSNIRSLSEKISWKSLATLILKEIPELECLPEIECLDGLKVINILECYNLNSIPSSILKLKSLKELDISNCLNLSAITEQAYSHSDFHWSLPRLYARNCFSLGTLPDLEQLFTFKPRLEQDEFNFSNCLAIEEGTWNKMVTLAKAKIQSTAMYYYFQGKAYRFFMTCPGCEIPKWIKHQNMGNFITVQLPIHKRFIGFAVSAVLARGGHYCDFQLHFKDASGINFDLEKTEKANYHCPWPYLYHWQSEHLFLTYFPFLDYDKVVRKLGATDEYYEITFEMSSKEVIACGVVPLYAQSVDEKLETPQSEMTRVTINSDLEVYVDKHQVENPNRLIISRTCQEARLEISKVKHTSTPSAHLGTLYYTMGDERCRNVSCISWLSDQRCLKCCPQELTSDSSVSDEGGPLIEMSRIRCVRESLKKCMEHDNFDFEKCYSVDWSKITVLAQIRLQAMAMCSYFQDKLYNFEMVYPGYEIPEWIKHQNTGNSITIQVPVNRRILGFALAAVHSACVLSYCTYKVQFNNASGDSFDWKQYTSPPEFFLFPDSHVILIYSSFRDCEYDRLVEKLGCVGDCYEVSCEFYDYFGIVNQHVIKCGMVPLYVRIPNNDGLEKPLDETTRGIVKRVEEKLEIFVDGCRVQNSKESIVLRTFQEAGIEIATLNCIWGEDRNFGSLRGGEAQIKEFNQGTEQNDEFLQRTPTSTFYERLIKNGVLHLDDYPMKRLPTYIHPEELVRLDIRYSEVEKLWEGKQDLKNLKILDLFSSSIVKLPDLSLATNLENMRLRSCSGLVEIPFSMSHLNKLQSLDLSFCENLTSLPSSISWKSLKKLDLRWCTKLECFPEIECLDALEELYMSGCINLKSLPHSIWKLKSLSKFSLWGSCLENLSEINECPLSSAFQLEKVVTGRSYKGNKECDQFDFSNWSKVDEVIHSQIISLTKMRIQVVALHCYFQNLKYSSQIVFPRGEIPEWIKHQNEGSSITIRLPIHQKFIGFALAVVLPAGLVCFDFELHFRNASSDCSFGSYQLQGGAHQLESEHVYIRTYFPEGHDSIYNEIVKKLYSSGENYDATLVVSCRDGYYKREDEKYIIDEDVMKCGIVPLYAQNARCKQLKSRPHESNMVTVHRILNDRLEASVDGFRVQHSDQEVILQTCKEAGIETSEDQTYLEPYMASKHLGTMYCVWGYQKCSAKCAVCNHCEDEDDEHDIELVV